MDFDCRGLAMLCAETLPKLLTVAKFTQDGATIRNEETLEELEHTTRPKPKPRKKKIQIRAFPYR
jgi:hypothetical protein